MMLYYTVILYYCNLYILRGFEKLIISFFTVKNTSNLINLFLFLEKRNKIKMINQLNQKIRKKGYPPMAPKNKNKNKKNFHKKIKKKTTHIT